MYHCSILLHLSPHLQYIVMSTVACRVNLVWVSTFFILPDILTLWQLSLFHGYFNFNNFCKIQIIFVKYDLHFDVVDVWSGIMSIELCVLCVGQAADGLLIQRFMLYVLHCCSGTQHNITGGEEGLLFFLPLCISISHVCVQQDIIH